MFRLQRTLQLRDINESVEAIFCNDVLKKELHKLQSFCFMFYIKVDS